MNFLKMFFLKSQPKKCGGCKINKKENTTESISRISLLEGRLNDLELDYIELENINASLVSDNGELKNKNNELISILSKVSDIAKVGVECNKKGY